VTHHGCDIGFAQDPDGDRLAIVNERGEPIGEDLTLALAAQQVLDRHGKGPVAVNLSASKCIEHVARARGCEVIKTRIGEVNVSEAMLKAGAVVGGEGTGGVIIPRMHPCRDSYVAMAVILELLAVEQKSVSAVRAGIPEYALIKDKVGIRAEQAPGVLRRLRQHYEDRLDCELNLQDGIYVDFGEKWVHVRRSNTESVLRLTAEAPAAAAAEALMVEVKNRIQMALGDGAANP